MPFVPGQLVKFAPKDGVGPVNRWDERKSLACLPKRGVIYTIGTINHWPAGDLVTLVECDNSHLMRNGYEPGFNALHFRPIDDKALDIFRQVLTDAPMDEDTV